MNNDKQNKAGQLQTAIKTALAKLGAKNESAIRRYLRAPAGGYMHHFTYNKKKKENPDELYELINESILVNAKPKPVPHKPRAARGSRKSRDRIIFSRADLDGLLDMARRAGNTEMMRKLTKNQDIRTIKRDLITAIRHDRVEPELWNSWVAVMQSQNFLSENAKSRT